MQIKKRLTYANVMSSLAVFLVLGGATAFAASKIGANQLKANSVKTGKIVKEAVTAGKIRNGAVTAPKLAAGAVGASALGAGSITGDKIAAGTISRNNLSEGVFLPRAFGLVRSNGTVVPGLTRGLPNASRANSAYCFDLPFQVLHAQVSGEADGEGNDLASVLIAGSEEDFEECPAGTDVEVETWDTGSDTETEEEFYLVLW